MNTKRILSLLLVLLMAVSVLTAAVSCGEPTGRPSQSDSTESDAETETNTPYADLEKEKYNRGFTILLRDDCKDDFVVEGMKGDVLGDSLYERNTVVSDDYGVTFSYQDKDYNGVNETVKQ